MYYNGTKFLIFFFKYKVYFINDKNLIDSLLYHGMKLLI
jgi:hypothetical protein